MDETHVIWATRSAAALALFTSASVMSTWYTSSSRVKRKSLAGPLIAYASVVWV
jgi:hypothetical protein